MARRTYSRNRPSRGRAVANGARIVPTKVYGDAPPTEPRKSQVAADTALQSIVDMFTTGELPAAIASTVIARAEGCSPSANWSLGNQLLMILAGTTDARGFRQWEEVGRRVVKGARAFYILAPITRKRTAEDPATGETREVPFVVGFKGIPVFRIEDTEGPPVQTYADYRPATFPPLYDVAERLGVSVRYVPFIRDFRGCYSPGDDAITLCTHDADTWFHELGHAAHKRVLSSRGQSLKSGQNANQEIVAETVAAVLCKLFDLDGYVYDGARYVEAYAKGENPGRAVLRVLSDVQACLYLILDTADADAVPEPVAAAA